MRDLPLLVSFWRMPLRVCSVLSAIESCPLRRSTAPHVRAVTSPRRRPQSDPSSTGMNMRVGRKWSSKRAVSDGSSAFIFWRSTFGGRTASAGLRASDPHIVVPTAPLRRMLGIETEAA